MNFIKPDAEELSGLRADPLLWAQELDVRPDVAEAIEKATGIRAGQVYWRSEHDYLYGMELGDLGRGRPSTATVYGYWDRFEPRPPDHEIDQDLYAVALWVAGVAKSLNPDDIKFTAMISALPHSWPQGSVLRTPEQRFANLPGYDFAPKYAEFEGLRMAYVEAGAGDPILMLHGEPTWGYVYRHMIPPLAKEGRVIVPDLIGFGRSDKPASPNAYTCRSHARWVRRFIEALDLKRITLVCQDWGGLLGLRVLAQAPDRFARVVAMNTGIPDGRPAGDAFMAWRRFCEQAEALDVPALVQAALRKRKLTATEAAAYAAPFPSAEFQTAALQFPRLVPIRPNHPGAYDNRVAIERLKTLDLPVLLPWADGDPISAGAEAHLRSIFRNVAPPLAIKGAGHFVQEDAGEEIAGHIARWMRA